MPRTASKPWARRFRKTASAGTGARSRFRRRTPAGVSGSNSMARFATARSSSTAGFIETSQTSPCFCFFGSLHCLLNEAINTGYAIEYDCVDPTELDRTLRVKSIDGPLSRRADQRHQGYEEAACQGIMAGINAALWLKGEPAFTLDRSEDTRAS